MTKEQLSEYRDLQKEIKRLQKRIENLKDVNQGKVTDIVKGSSIEFPYTQHPIQVEGFDAAHRITYIIRMEGLLRARKLKSINESMRIAEFICDIPKVKIRTIFEYRYYELLTWQQIAFKIECTSEAYPRNLHDKYLEEVRFSTNVSC